jgi:hypothetical protein
MSKIRLDSKEAMRSLAALLGRMAEAISWVSHQRGKISLEFRPLAMRDEGPIIYVDPDSCDVRPRKMPAEFIDRLHTEILLGILKRLPKRVPQRPKATKRR